MIKGAIETFTGRLINPLNPNPDCIVIEDIARSLSMQCRFNGHCRRFYSVAEHSVNTAVVAEHLAPDNHLAAIFALLHDASEAYLCDIPRPLKSEFPNYLQWEKSLSDIIYAKFANSVPNIADLEIVGRADDIMLVTEALELTHSSGSDWGLGEAPVDYIKKFGIQPAEAEQTFLAKLEELNKYTYKYT